MVENAAMDNGNALYTINFLPPKTVLFAVLLLATIYHPMGVYLIGRPPSPG